MKVAATGKGGVGKTTVTAMLARVLGRQMVPVVAVDADPNPNLAIALGLGIDRAARVRSVANALIDEKAAHDHDHDHAACETLPDDAEGLLDRLGELAPDNVRLLQTGRIQRPSEGCLCCGSHRTSRRVFEELAAEHRVVVADLEAGVNDLMWIWPKPGDVTLIITEPYWKSLEVARRALHVTRELGVTDALVVANRIQVPSEVDYVREFLPGADLVAIPDDPEVAAAAVAGLSIFDTAPESPAVEAVERLARSIAPPVGWPGVAAPVA